MWLSVYIPSTITLPLPQQPAPVISQQSLVEKCCNRIAFPKKNTVFQNVLHIKLVSIHARMENKPLCFSVASTQTSGRQINGLPDAERSTRWKVKWSTYGAQTADEEVAKMCRKSRCTLNFTLILKQTSHQERKKESDTERKKVKLGEDKWIIVPSLCSCIWKHFSLVLNFLSPQSTPSFCARKKVPLFKRCML